MNVGIIAFLIIGFFGLMFLGVPIAMSMGLSAIGCMVFISDANLLTVCQRMFEGMNSFALLAIPLFTLSGFTMSAGGISDRLMDWCYSLVGRIPGGLGHVNILSSMVFAGISGSAVADTAGVSGMMMPNMVKNGFPKEEAVAITAISSTIGIIIPPSIPMVVISGIVGISTGKMFMGGIIPGILLGLAQMIVCYINAKRWNLPVDSGHFSIKEFLRNTWRSLPALLMPLIIVGSISAGLVSPTEVGVIAVAYGLIAGGLVYKELKLPALISALKETVKTSARIFVIIGAAKLYTVMLTTAGFDKWVAKTMLGVSTNPTVITLIIMAIFFIATMFMETNAALMLFLPIIYPVAISVGVDPIVLGVLITIMVGVGLVTPPVGMCLYVAADLMKLRVGKVMPYLISYIVVTFVVIGILIAFPNLILITANLAG